MNKSAFLLVTFFLIKCVSSFGTTYFVAPTGNNSNPGSIKSPFSTIMQAQEVVEPGDTVYIRGGKFQMEENHISTIMKIWAVVFHLNKSGKPDKRIHYFAFPGEKPVFDFSKVKPVNQRIMAFKVTGSWIHIRGIEVTGVQVTILTHTQSECFHNEGSNNIYEQLSMHDGQAIGFYLTKGSDNLILNCDAYNNKDTISEGGRGGNVDGFGCHPQQGGTGNVFRGCRAWFNSDDGYDCIRAAETVVFENCWAFYNGYDADFKSLGDGNGFKAGGWGLKKDDRVPDSIPGHVVRFCLAVKNKANGFYSNHHPSGSIWINNTAWLNGTNYNMLNRNADFTEDVPGFGHELYNNLSFEPRTYETQHIDYNKCTLNNNSFNLNLNITVQDFENLNLNHLTQVRNSDGSLPVTGFMKPSEKSKLIDKGVIKGFPYKGKAPDLGAFER